jgi:hypothetical protein
MVPTMRTAFSTSNIQEGRKEEKQGVGSQCVSGIGNARRDSGAANPVRTEHGDITAAASAIFASANANSWTIGEHHA